MIGWVEFVEGGVTLCAILDDVGRWNCGAAPDIAAALNRDRSRRRPPLRPPRPWPRRRSGGS